MQINGPTGCDARRAPTACTLADLGPGHTGIFTAINGHRAARIGDIGILDTEFDGSKTFSPVFTRVQDLRPSFAAIRGSIYPIGIIMVVSHIIRSQTIDQVAGSGQQNIRIFRMHVKTADIERIETVFLT